MWCMDPYQQERRRQGWGEEAGLMMGEDMGATWFWGSHETDILISFSGEELKLPSNFGFPLHPKHGKAALQRETQKLTVTNVPGIFSGDEFPDVWLGPAICCLTVTRFLFFFKKKEKQICPCLCAPLRLLLQRHHKIFIHGKISLIPASRVTCRDGFHAPGLKSAQTCNPNSECKGFSSAPPRSAPSRGTPRGASAPSRSFSGGRTQAEDVRSFSNRWVAFLFFSFFL